MAPRLSAGIRWRTPRNWLRERIRASLKRDSGVAYFTRKGRQNCPHRVRLSILEVAPTLVEGSHFWGGITDPSHPWLNVCGLQNREADPPAPLPLREYRARAKGLLFGEVDRLHHGCQPESVGAPREIGRCVLSGWAFVGSAKRNGSGRLRPSLNLHRAMCVSFSLLGT